MVKKTGCLIIHGFGGCIEEISPLSNYLASKGYTTVCPVLRGHTGKRSDLKDISYNDWIISAEEGLHKLKADYDNIVLIGFSMGGLIAINLANKYNVDAVVTLNTPIYYWDFKRIFLNIIEDINNKELSNIKRYLKSSLDKPLSSLVNFKKLLIKTKPLIKEVKCPIFIAQALEDDTVQKRSAEYIFENVKIQQKYIKYYKGSGHLICLSGICGEVFDDINKFIECTIKTQ